MKNIKRFEVNVPTEVLRLSIDIAIDL